MSFDPHCRQCHRSFELSQRNIWKALCLDCAEEERRRSIDPWEAALDGWKERAEMFERENKSLKGNQGRHSGQIDHLKQQHQVQLDVLTQKVRVLMKENEQLRAASSRSSSKHRDVSSDLHHELESKESCIRSLSATISSLSSEVSSLKKKLEAAGAERHKAMSALHATIDDKNSEIADLKSSMISLHAQLAKARSDNANLQSVVQLKSSEVQRLEQRVCEVEDRMAERDRARRQELTNLHNCNGRKSSRIRDLEDQVMDLEEQLNSERQDVRAAMLASAGLRAENAELLNTVDDFRTRMFHVLGTSAQTQISLQEARAQIADLTRKQQQHEAVCPASGNTEMLKESLYTDMCMTAGSEALLVHKAVLASRSPVFATMLRNPMRESKEGLIEIKDMSAEALRHFVHYLYTGTLETDSLSEVLCSEVLEAAHKYNVQGLNIALQTLGHEDVAPSTAGLRPPPTR